ncbi:MAG TPA: DUF5719 family protein [Nitriliruptorales bacterium]|nr:DUF5719 family protein [Nitriliruptorales bacterium]
MRRWPAPAAAMRTVTSTLLALGLVVVAAVAGAVLDLVAPPADVAAPSPGVADQAVSGAWYCAVGDTAEGDAMFVAAAAPPSVPAGGAVRIDTFDGGQAQRGEESDLFPGAMTVRGVPGGHEQLGVAVRWWQSPVAVSRLWLRGVAGEPSGPVEGPCTSEPSVTWFLPGVTTVDAAQARIVLANPFETDAAISVELLSPEGVERPQLLKNVTVQARSVQVVDLNRHAPEVADLGAVVRVRAGRVVAEAWQSLDAAVGGIEGVTLVRLAPAPRDAWTIPWFQGAGATSWLWVTNPGERPASVTVTVHTGAGGVPPEGLEEIDVPAGAVRRVDLRGVLPEDVGGGAATVTSVNGVPVVVSGATQIRTPSGERSGHAVQLGEPRADTSWTIPTGPGGGRTEVLHLVNPTAQPATAQVQIVDATATLAPEELQAVGVPPGTAVDIDLSGATEALDQHTIFVTSQGSGVVAGVHTFNRATPLGLVAHPGVPSWTWTGGRPVAPVEFAPGLPQRLGTDLGPATTPSPSPSPVVTTPPTPRSVEEPSPTGEAPQPTATAAPAP